MFTLLVRHPLSSANVVFVQYLAGLAMVHALGKVLGEEGGDMIRLKWPNDIYAYSPSGKKGKGLENYRKIGGILVTSSIENGKFSLLIGIGLNVSNTSPTICVNDVARRAGVSETCREAVLASFMHIFEEMYARFYVTGFAAFETAYYKAWLHSGQDISMEGDVVRGTGARVDDLRVEGIDLASGLLRARGRGQVYLLQPDGNSFDMMKGLIKRKL
jgi:biotin--protein ligase